MAQDAPAVREVVDRAERLGPGRHVRGGPDLDAGHGLRVGGIDVVDVVLAVLGLGAANGGHLGGCGLGGHDGIRAALELIVVVGGVLRGGQVVEAEAEAEERVAVDAVGPVTKIKSPLAHGGLIPN